MNSATTRTRIARMVFRSPGFIREEVERTDAVIRAAGYQGPIYFRPPFCYKLVGLPWLLARSGRTSVTWDVEPDSYRDVAASASGIVSHVVERVRPGSIVLLHVWHGSRQTSRAADADDHRGDAGEGLSLRDGQ